MNQGFNISADAPQDFLFIGSPGSGKTSLALRFPAPYVLDCDNNLRPAVQYTDITDFKYDIAVLEDDRKTLLPGPKRYAKLVERLNAACSDPSIKTIIVDSLTALADIICSEVKRQNGLADDKPMRIQDWGDFAYLMRNLIIKLKASGKHFILTAHHRVEKDEADQTWKYLLYVPGQSQFILSGLFSNVWTLFFDITGVGSTATEVLKVRTIPISKNDFRGAKSGLKQLKTEQTVDSLIKELPTIVK